MRLCQPFSHVLQVSQQLSQFSSLAMNLLAKRNAFHKLHRDEMRAIVFSDLEDLCNVRMTQCGGGFCLAHKAVHALAIRCDFGGKYLQRYFAIEPGVLREIHLAHSTRADFRDDTVVRKY